MRKLRDRVLVTAMSLALIVGLCPGLAYAVEGDIAVSDSAAGVQESDDGLASLEEMNAVESAVGTETGQVEISSEAIATDGSYPSTDEIASEEIVGDAITSNAEPAQEEAPEEGSGLFAQMASSKGYCWPLRSAGSISQGYSYNASTKSGHGGIDIAIGQGSDVLASMSGTVKYVHRYNARTSLNDTTMNSYGNLVILYHPSNGTTTYYAHMKDISVSVGQQVSQGQVVGHVGLTGATTGYHLHFELRTGATSSQSLSGQGTRQNPLNYVNSSNLYEPKPTYPTPITIENGVYLIHTGVSKYRVIEIAGSSKENSANVQLGTSNCGANQQFRFTRCSDGAYIITNVNSGKVLDVLGGSTANNSNVGQYKNLDRGKQSNKYLNVTNNKYEDGANIQIWSGGPGDGHPFILSKYADFGTPDTSIASGNYVILSAKNKTYGVDAVAADVASGTNLNLFSSLQNPGQVFTFSKQGNGTYRISPLKSSKVVFDVYGGSLVNGGNIRLYTSNDSLAQRWIIRSCGGGVYALQCAGTGMFLDVSGGNMSNKTNIQQYVGNNSEAQEFYLVPWSKAMTDKRVIVQGVDASYKATGAAITPSPNVKWLANSLDSLRVPDSGNASTAYIFREILVAKAGRTYIIEIDKAKRLAGNASNAQIRAVGAGGLDVADRPTVKWSDSRQTVTITPTKNCSLYIYPAVAEQTKGCAAEFTGVRIYEQLVNGTDYTASYKDNVNAGTATMTVAGKGDFSGSKAITYTIVAAQQPPAPAPAPGGGGGSGAPSASMHRLYNPNSGEHFYTADDAERDGLASLGWSYEGVGWTAPASSGAPVYRMYNPVAGEHHYTPDAAERDMLVGAGWNDEGVGWYSADEGGVPLYRDYNPNAFANNHNYTADWSEHQALVDAGWRDEGIAWYGA